MIDTQCCYYKMKIETLQIKIVLRDILATAVQTMIYLHMILWKQEINNSMLLFPYFATIFT